MHFEIESSLWCEVKSECVKYYTSVILRQGSSGPPENICQCLEILPVATTEFGWRLLHILGEARDAAHHPSIHKTALWQRLIWLQNQQCLG